MVASSPTLASRLRPAAEVLVCDLEGEAVLLHTGTGRYYGLDEVGFRMWTLISEHAELEVVHRRLLEEYDVPAETLKGDLVAFAGRLQSVRLLIH